MLNVRITPVLDAALRAHAVSLGRSRSDVVKSILEAAFVPAAGGDWQPRKRGRPRKVQGVQS